jgi:alkylation response protein AidB-like acyl-CoA dehydrogenase
MTGTAIAIPESLGGLGASRAELAVVFEEAGRALMCGPLLSTTLGATAIQEAASTEQAERLLPPLASGEQLAALCLTPIGRSGEQLTGAVRGVIDGQTADWLVVSTGEDVFAVPTTLDGVSATMLPTMDQTRRLAEVRLDGVSVSDCEQLDGGVSAVERAVDIGRAMLAAEQVGIAEWCLDTTVEYAKTRTQFGTPIGAFQAVKHMCADMLLRVESARSAAADAARAACGPAADLALAASTAQTYCSEAAFFCASHAIQIHGGIGFTWEHDCHLYFKRARANEALLGTPSYHRERVLRELGI